MIYHIVVGDVAAKPLAEAVLTEPSMQGTVVVMRDILHIGPIRREDGQPFSRLRSDYWQEVAPSEKNPIEVDDMERLLEVSNELYKDTDAQAWFWMAPGPADVCAYHWMLPYLSKHPGRFFLLNVANLPFLDEAGKVFYPNSLGVILPRELVKARRLARPVTPSEVEIDGEEWNKLVAENAGIRTHEGGKKLASRDERYYDDRLLACCDTQFRKASRILHAAMSRSDLPTGDTHLAWRLRRMAEEGALQIQGDPRKTFRDWEVRLPSTTGQDTITGADAGQ